MRKHLLPSWMEWNPGEVMHLGVMILLFATTSFGPVAIAIHQASSKRSWSIERY